jgi:hypothetical protein
MAIANATLVANVNENINPKWIEQQQRISAGRSPFIFGLGVVQRDLSMMNTKVLSWPIRDEVAKASSYTETDLVTSTPIDRQAVEITTDKVLKATFLSIEAVELSMWDEFSGAIDELTQANLRAADDEYLELADDFSNDIGDSTAVFGIRQFVATQTAYRAQTRTVAGVPLMVLESSVLGQLHDDAVSNGAALLGSQFGPQLQAATDGLQLGELTRFMGVDIVPTTGLPPGDVNGISNMMHSTTDRDGSIAMPFQHRPRIDQAWRPENQGWWVICSFNFEVGIVNNLTGITIITKP